MEKKIFNTKNDGLSYSIHVRSLPLKGYNVHLSAHENECNKLAQNHGLIDVKFFESELKILPWKKRGVRVKGFFKAKITQHCVVSLEPVESTLHEKVETIFLPQDSRLVKPDVVDESGELFLDSDGPDAPEIFTGDIIDVGHVLEEFFELSIDPYPRKQHFNWKNKIEIIDEMDKISPFAALKKLK
ncbi:DUF177 domain-containing protein [Bartonella tamiae]|nr:DUF177 domain-containing protein [Bartonella tamiae]